MIDKDHCINDLKKIPIISKDDFYAAEPIDLIDKRIKDRSKLITLKTSGSSGRVLQFFVNQHYNQLRKAQFLRPYISNGTGLFNRQSVPIPFDKQATYILDVLYRQTVWPMIGDVLADITVDGNVYKTITRGAAYTNTIYKAPWSAMSWGGGGTRGYSGDIGATPADWPSGTFGSAVGVNRVIAPYVPGDYYIELKTNYYLGNYNVGGIHAFIHSFNRCYFQTSFHVDAGQTLPEFDPIPKTDTKVGDCTFRMSWARH